MSESNYHTTKWFSENSLAIEMKNLEKNPEKTVVFINKPIHQGLSILHINKIPLHDFCYDYTKLKYGGKTKLWYK